MFFMFAYTNEIAAHNDLNISTMLHYNTLCHDTILLSMPSIGLC